MLDGVVGWGIGRTPGSHAEEDDAGGPRHSSACGRPGRGVRRATRARLLNPRAASQTLPPLLDGCRLETLLGVGKHLFVGFDVGQPASTVHIHLGLIGKLFVAPLAPPRGQVRMRINDDDLAADLYGPQVCELLSATEIERVVGSKAPTPSTRRLTQNSPGSASGAVASPLRRCSWTSGSQPGWQHLPARRCSPAPGRPMTPGRQLHRAHLAGHLARPVALMPLGVIDGRIDSVRPNTPPKRWDARPGWTGTAARCTFYRRTGQPCLVCGRPVSTSVLEGRNLYWCSTCQRVTTDLRRRGRHPGRRRPPQCFDRGPCRGAARRPIPEPVGRRSRLTSPRTDCPSAGDWTR